MCNLRRQIRSNQIKSVYLDPRKKVKQSMFSSIVVLQSMDILRVVSLVLQQHVMEIAEEKEPLREGASECDLSSKSDWIFSIKILPLAVLCRKCPRIA